jgi:hypothetical protein
MNIRDIKHFLAALGLATGLTAATPFVTMAHPISGSWSDNHVLRRNWTGDVVAFWQNILYAEGYLDDCGADGIDGIFGANTERATRMYQADYHVTGGADGVVGRNTWSKAASKLRWVGPFPSSNFYYEDRYKYVGQRKTVYFSRLRGKGDWRTTIPARGGADTIGSDHPKRTFTPCVD